LLRLIAAPRFSAAASPSPTLQRLPERILEKCVKGMLPKGRIASPLFQHLKVYKGSSHPHEAQRPLDITSRISKKPSEAL
jgi:large subunit ribosomal protein L13